MAKVIAREGEDLDSLIRRFKKAVEKAGILEDVKKHEYFLKKSLRRKQKSKLARIKNLKGRW